MMKSRVGIPYRDNQNEILLPPVVATLQPGQQNVKPCELHRNIE